MSTELFIISNIKTTKAEVLPKKDLYLEQLKALKLSNDSGISARTLGI